MDLPNELIDMVLKYLHPIEVEQCYRTSRVFHVLSVNYILNNLVRFEKWVVDDDLRELVTSCSREKPMYTARFFIDFGVMTDLELMDYELSELLGFPKYTEMNYEDWVWWLYQYVEEHNLAIGLWQPDMPKHEMHTRGIYNQPYNISFDNTIKEIMRLSKKELIFRKLSWRDLIARSWEELFYQ